MAQPRVGCFCFKKLEHSVLEIGTRIILTALPWPGLPDFWLKSVGCCGVFNRPGTLNKPEAARRITIQHAQSIKNLKRIWCILEKRLYNYNVLSLEPDLAFLSTSPCNFGPESRCCPHQTSTAQNRPRSHSRSRT